MLKVSLLGDFDIRHDAAPVAGMDTPRLQSLLAYLLLHRGALLSRAHLAYLFWPDTTEAQARTNLRNLLHHLRHALPDADSYLETGVSTLEWRSDAPLTLDVDEWQTALAEARQAPNGAARESLERAVALYRGDLLPSCYDDWIIPLREGQRQDYVHALERLVRVLEEQRDYGVAIDHARRLLRFDPLHEATYRQLIRLYALNGDRAAALRVYHTCATVLKRELDVEPGAATREVYEQLLGVEAHAPPTAPATTAFSALVGREAEWAAMLQTWRAVAAGAEPHLVMLSGEAGIGKTRLAEELLQWAARQGIASASARCYAAEGELAYAPATAWLRARPLARLEDVWLAEVARLLPDVLDRRPDLPRPVALTEAWQRRHLFEALSRAILGTNQPLLLAMDDLQWCDRDTLEWLHFLLRFDRTARVMVIATFRPEEVGEGHPLRSTLQALRLEGQVTEIDLRPLDEAATRALAGAVAGRELSTTTAQLLYRETEGNPLFVVETVRAGLPELGPGAAGRLAGLPREVPPGETGLPPKVQSVLQARLAQVSAPTRELAELAATIGREFGFTLLAKASGRDEEALVRQLDELWQRRIVREHGADGYDFSHDKLREVAYRSVSAARRRLLHLHAARALEGLYGSTLDPVSHQLAAHYERAGLPEQAVPYYLRAASVARRVFANEEAQALLERGLALVEEHGPVALQGEPGHEVVAALHEGMGDLFELKSDHERALEAYQNALARAPPGDRIGRARLFRKVGAVRREQRLYAESLAACHRAEVALGNPPDKEPGPWWVEWLEVQIDRVWAHYWLAQWPEMDELVQKIEPLVQERGAAASRQRFLMASCLMHLRRERYAVTDEMLADSSQALVLSRECGDLKNRMDCQFELGFLQLWRRDLEPAEENLLAALELAETSGVASFRTLSLTYLTVLDRFLGRLDGVRDYTRRAREAAEAAHMPDYVAAARANEAWLAWREKDQATAEQKGREALAIWQQSPLVYPFHWQALWPLLAVALAQGDEDEAWTHARALLEPTQQLLPDGLNYALEAAVKAKREDGDRAARSHLERVLALATEFGYL